MTNYDHPVILYLKLGCGFQGRLPKTNSLHLKFMVGRCWENTFLFVDGLFDVRCWVGYMCHIICMSDIHIEMKYDRI